MTISAKMILDSVNPQGHRLRTMELRYPKMIHGEAKTHRVLRINDTVYEFLQEVGFMDDPSLSRNASSSRAVPIQRIINEVMLDPAIPSFSGANQPGMQAGESLTDEERQGLIIEWLAARDGVVNHVNRMIALRGAKQDVNRALEPWSHIKVIVSGTDFSNFYALRRAPDAQPEMKALADAMWECEQASTPQVLKPGDWHLPYITNEDCREAYNGPSQSESRNMLKHLSVARVARVSYRNFDGTVDIEKDLALYDQLLSSRHMSPFEHQATPDVYLGHDAGHDQWAQSDQHGNFTGWRQHRKMLPNECFTG